VRASQPGQSLSWFDEASASLADKLGLMVAFTGLMGVSAQFKVPMPPDGVPQTLQTLVAVVAAMGLGARWGVGSMLLYVAVGAAGAGVFAEGKAGVEVLLAQTGGYLVGFVLSQPVIAGLVRRGDGTVRGWGALATASLAGHAVVFACGVPWLTYVRGLEDPSYTLMRGIKGGFVPFLPGTVLKTAAAVLIGLTVYPESSRRFW
jgi:biotin transport system substrate-specific component